MAARPDFEESFCGTFWRSLQRILSVCTVTLLVFMAGGVSSLVVEEQAEDQTWGWTHLVQVAAFVAPATVTLMQVWGRTSVQSLGYVLTVLGMTVPLLMPPGRAQGVAFSVGLGVGVSVMFQASILTAVDYLHRWRSLLLMGLTVVSMVTASPLLKMLNKNCSKPVVLATLVWLSVLHLLLSLVGKLCVRCCSIAKDHNGKVQQSSLVNDEKTISIVNPDAGLYWMSHTGRQEGLDFSTQHVSGSQNRKVSAESSKGGLMSVIGTLLLWGTGIQVTVSAGTDTPAWLKLAWVCLLSCLVLGARMLTTHLSRETSRPMFSEDNACIFLTAVLGMGAVFSLHYPQTVDPKSFIFLFAMSFSHQLKFHEHFKISSSRDSSESSEKKTAVDCQEASMEPDHPVLLVCAQLVWTLIALFSGYFLAGFLLPPALSLTVNLTYSCCEISIFLMSSLMVVLSFIMVFRKVESASDVRHFVTGHYWSKTVNFDT